MNKQILVVEDSHLVRMYYRQILEPEGYAVTEAANGSEGIERALEQDFDVFIVDINMPMMDGFTFLERIRDISSSPAIVISTEASEEDAQKAYEAGASFFIVKPVSSDNLLRNINMLAGT
ncbi:MAG TPA: response regulator [Methylophilaceae bacterium]|nr:response regulator [Methylophilaceae bacterium]